MEKRYQVFISSTYEDLKKERDKVAQAILHSGNFPVGMEQFQASNQNKWDYITETIEKSDFYIVIIGGRYGSVDDESGISYTEKEYDYALEKKIPILTFIHSDIDSLPAKKTDQNDTKREKLKNFISKASKVKVTKKFKNADDIYGCAYASLNEAIKTTPTAVGWLRVNEIENEKQAILKLQNKNEQITYKPNTAISGSPVAVRSKRKEQNSFKKTTSSDNDLKEMEMIIEISGTLSHYTKDTAYKERTDWEIKTTFLEIFKKLSPHLSASMENNSVKKLIAEKAYSIKIQREYNGSDTITINDYIFENIKIQFVKCKLIKLEYDWSVPNLWFLTDKGKKLMMDLRTTKNAQKDIL
jgi:hypothetical protein